MEYVSHTPRWVFALFVALCAIGLVQTRTRRIRFALALLLPCSMLILSIAGVLQYTAHWGAALAYWGLGLVISTWGLSRMLSRYFVRRDVDRLIVQGSWSPLLVILGIFIIRYGLEWRTLCVLRPLKFGPCKWPWPECWERPAAILRGEDGRVGR